MEEQQPRSVLTGANVLLGIDDTDRIDSSGTGHLAERLLRVLQRWGLGRAVAESRHQLLVDTRIPYTSHNASSCIAWDGGACPDLEEIAARAGAILDAQSSSGSNPCLVVTGATVWSDPAARRALVDFGRRAKLDILDLCAATGLAAKLGVHASGHGGSATGIIGALAAVGLYLSGADGRFRWLPGIRLLRGRMTYGELLQRVPVDAAMDPSGTEPQPDDMIDLGDWVRPVLRDGRAVLLLQPRKPPGPPSQPTEWTLIPRHVVKDGF